MLLKQCSPAVSLQQPTALAVPLEQQPSTPRCSVPPHMPALCAKALQQRPAPPFPPVMRAECRGVPTPAGMMV